MIEDFRNYITSRISVLFVLSSAIAIFLFAVPFELIHPFSFFDLMKILLALLCLNFYDDIFKGYDKAQDRHKLALVFCLFFSVLSWLANSIDLAAMWIYFFVLNHILYKALAHLEFWSFIIPVFKYPVIFFSISAIYFRELKFDFPFFLSCVAIFLSGLVFHWLERIKEGRRSFVIYLFSVLVIAILVFNQMNMVSFTAGVLALICMTLFFVFAKRNVQFIWVLIVLLLRVAALNF